MARETAEVRNLVKELDNGFKWGKRSSHTGLHGMDGSLCEMWKDPEAGIRHLLQKFLCWARGFPPVLECVVRGLLPGGPQRSLPTASESVGSPEEAHDLDMDSGDDNLYRAGRNGDHLMGVPFECDMCHFRNMNKRDPVWEKVEDV